ncbi:MAG: KGK domain-containing protein [Nostoc sp.]|uniref:KGK domain-containing protein n=1 Tax=Nostoc sp. TaxID=1180 RepID=UPI002FF4799B
MSDEIYLRDNDVVSFQGVDYSFANAQTVKVNEIKNSLMQTWFKSHLSGWIAHGIPCKVLLEEGGGWQAGKIRFRLEFIPSEPKVPEPKPSTVTSEPQSPLADLRSQLNPE